MKKILSLAFLATLFLSVSCVKGEKFADESLLKAPGVYGYLAQPVSDDPGTKATFSTDMRFAFEVGDHINIWSEVGTLLIYSVTELTPSGGAVFNGGGFTLTDGMTYYTLFPLISSFKEGMTEIPVSYEGQVQTADGSANHVAPYSQMLASATCEDGATHFSYRHLSRWVKFELTLPQEMTVTELTLTADSPVFAKEGKVNVMEGTFTPTVMTDKMTLLFDNVTVTDGVLNAFVALSTYAACNVVVSVKDDQEKVYSSPVVSQNSAATPGNYRIITQTLTQEAPDVAEIDGVRYKSLADAVAAVPYNNTPTTITMIADETIPVDVEITPQIRQNIILDLNGHTISKVGFSSDRKCLIFHNYGDLTIKDSSDSAQDGTGSGKMVVTPKDYVTGEMPMNAVQLIHNHHNLYIESGLFDVLEGNGTLNTVVMNGDGGKLYISGGKLINRIGQAQAVILPLGIWTSNIVDISGTAVLEGYYGVYVIYTNGTDNKGDLNISGGVFNTTNYAVRAYSVEEMDGSNFKVNISGGNFGGKGVYLYSDTPFQEISITGGHFYDLGATKRATKFITGGEFETVGSLFLNRLPDETMIADGYKVVLSGGLYVVVPESDPRPAEDIYPANTIRYYWLSGGVEEGTVADFYRPFDGESAALCDGEFITLLSNVTLSRDVPWQEDLDWCTPIAQDGGTFSLEFGEFDINLNGYAFPLPTGVSVKTDRQTDIFTALDPNYSVIESPISEGKYHYMYSVDTTHPGGNEGIGGGVDD